jgi:hypothetical protein
MDAIPPHERDLAAKYLYDGAVIGRRPAVLCHDLLDSDHRSIGPLRIQTDGWLVWPSDLPYYVRTYGVAIPYIMLQRMKGLSYMVPPMSDEDIQRARVELEQAPVL